MSASAGELEKPVADVLLILRETNYEYVLLLRSSSHGASTSRLCCTCEAFCPAPLQLQHVFRRQR